MNESKNKIKNANTATLSKLFNWYGGDFTKNGTLVDFINQYSESKLNEDADIDWMDYHWALNEQK